MIRRPKMRDRTYRPLPCRGFKAAEWRVWGGAMDVSSVDVHGVKLDQMRLCNSAKTVVSTHERSLATYANYPALGLFQGKD